MTQRDADRVLDRGQQTGERLRRYALSRSGLFKIRNSIGIIGVICGFVSTAICGVAAQAPALSEQGPERARVEGPPRGDAVRGQELFVKIGCYQCHGYEAQGASTGPKLGPEAMPFPRFVSYVRKPTGEMPPYSTKVTSDAQLADLYAFVTSRTKPEARPQLLRPPR
jgi:mono/diheme cytochrome c family protein